jgi:hypothetical protein
MNHECVMFMYCYKCKIKTCSVCQKCKCTEKCSICRLIGNDDYCEKCDEPICLEHIAHSVYDVSFCAKCFNEACDICGYIKCICKPMCKCGTFTMFMCTGCAQVHICKLCIINNGLCEKCREKDKCPHSVFMDLNGLTGKPRAEIELLTAILCMRGLLPRAIIIKILAETADYKD